MKIFIFILFFCGACIQFSFLTSIDKEANKSVPPATPIRFIIPKGFPEPVYKFKNNQLTQEGFELGRFLFYDGRLSNDGNFPCASCHQQFAAFATFEHRLSHGFNNQFSYRNAPGLFNIAWQRELHWDGGINHIEVQPLAPITDPHEMADNLDNIIFKLKKDTVCKKLFKAAYGDPVINSQRILKALAQFTASLISANSKYDQVMRGQASFSRYEQPGYQIFQQKCATCHKEPLFTDLSYRNTGISLDSSLRDFGRMRITGNKTDSLKFKVPSLRNVFLTGPYGHDGRFATISNVLDHYSAGVINSPTLDPLLKKGIPLTNDEKFYLIAFLGTLTDTSFVNDKRYSAPDSSGDTK